MHGYFFFLSPPTKFAFTKFLWLQRKHIITKTCELFAPYWDLSLSVFGSFLFFSLKQSTKVCTFFVFNHVRPSLLLKCTVLVLIKLSRNVCQSLKTPNNCSLLSQQMSRKVKWSQIFDQNESQDMMKWPCFPPKQTTLWPTSSSQTNTPFSVMNSSTQSQHDLCVMFHKPLFFQSL